MATSNEPTELDVLFLLFSEGMVPVRTTTVNRVIYDYDPQAEKSGFTGIAADTWYAYGVLASQKLNSNDMLLFSNSNNLLYVTFGIDPSVMQLYREYPKGVPVNIFGNNYWSQTNTQFGYVSGLMSKYMKPSDDSGMLLTPQQEPAFYFYNPTSELIYPKLKLYMSFIEYDYINDSQYIFDMINGTYPKKAKSYTLGSTNNPLKYAQEKENLMKGKAVLVPYTVASVKDIQNAGGV